jgi:hypothetical protein
MSDEDPISKPSVFAPRESVSKWCQKSPRAQNKQDQQNIPPSLSSIVISVKVKSVAVLMLKTCTGEFWTVGTGNQQLLA